MQDVGRMLRHLLVDDLRDQDNPPHLSRVQAALFAVNQSIRLLIKLNAIRNIRMLSLPSTPPFDSYPLPHRVTYAYLQGKHAAMEDRLEDVLNFLKNGVLSIIRRLSTSRSRF
jgi:hypothetical protein